MNNNEKFINYLRATKSILNYFFKFKKTNLIPTFVLTYHILALLLNLKTPLSDEKSLRLKTIIIT